MQSLQSDVRNRSMSLKHSRIDESRQPCKSCSMVLSWYFQDFQQFTHCSPFPPPPTWLGQLLHFFPLGFDSPGDHPLRCRSYGTVCACPKGGGAQRHRLRSQLFSPHPQFWRAPPELPENEHSQKEKCLKTPAWAWIFHRNIQICVNNFLQRDNLFCLSDREWCARSSERAMKLKKLVCFSTDPKICCWWNVECATQWEHTQRERINWMSGLTKNTQLEDRSKSTMQKQVCQLSRWSWSNSDHGSQLVFYVDAIF